MIDRAAITNWGASHPWSRPAFVEQDLVICRALVAIFSDPVLAEALAFRGGTALHKLFLSPQARYSEDIDLVQVAPGPAKPLVERLDAALAWLPGRTFSARRFGFRTKYRYESETPPTEPMRLKVEVNTFEHFAELGYAYAPFRVESPWFSGDCRIKTYAPAELLGTKLRALYQRRKGRDLFDLACAAGRLDVDVAAVLRCWRRYVAFGGHAVPTAAEFARNMEAKLALPDYGADVPLLLRPGTPFDVAAAYATVRETFIRPLED